MRLRHTRLPYNAHPQASLLQQMNSTCLRGSVNPHSCANAVSVLPSCCDAGRRQQARRCVRAWMQCFMVLLTVARGGVKWTVRICLGRDDRDGLALGHWDARTTCFGLLHHGSVTRPGGHCSLPVFAQLVFCTPFFISPSITALLWPYPAAVVSHCSCRPRL